MKNEQRPIVVAIAYSAVTKESVNHVYSYKDSKYYSVSCADVTSSANVYDYTRKCYVSVNVSGDKYNLYDYGERKYIDLTIRENDFEGYDYSSRKHFSGKISGNAIDLYDYQESKYFSYSI